MMETPASNYSTKQGNSMFDSDSSIDSVQGVNKPAKIDLNMIPAGSKVGDTITMKVKSIDAEQNCAYLIKADEPKGSEMDVTPASSGNTDQDANGTGEKTAPSTTLGTDLTMGPMSKLKNYLAKTSVDTQNQ